MFVATLVSSKGLHLKSFLYPPQSTFLFLHCSQPGFFSSHFRRLALQVTQPERYFAQYTTQESYSGTVTTWFTGRGGRLFPCSVSLLDGTRLVLLVVEYLLTGIKPGDRVWRGAEKDRRRWDCDCIRHVDDVLSTGYRKIPRTERGVQEIKGLGHDLALHHQRRHWKITASDKPIRVSQNAFARRLGMDLFQILGAMSYVGKSRKYKNPCEGMIYLTDVSYGRVWRPNFDLDEQLESNERGVERRMNESGNLSCIDFTTFCESLYLAWARSRRPDFLIDTCEIALPLPTMAPRIIRQRCYTRCYTSKVNDHVGEWCETRVTTSHPKPSGYFDRRFACFSRYSRGGEARIDRHAQGGISSVRSTRFAPLDKSGYLMRSLEPLLFSCLHRLPATIKRGTGVPFGTTAVEAFERLSVWLNVKSSTSSCTSSTGSTSTPPEPQSKRWGQCGARSLS
ncbi:hypothetical protein KCU62_g162, partial [Aureobasidium sp. EXF-3399]